GETFDIFKLLPPPVPDERNFAAIELLRDIRLPEGDIEAAKAAARRRDVLQRACDFLSRPSGTGVWLSKDIFGKAQAPDLKQAITTILDHKLLAWPDPSDHSPKALRSALEKHAPFIRELANAASAHPESEWLPRWDKSWVPEIWLSVSMNHIDVVMSVSRLMQLHALACLEAGDAEASLRDIQALVRLSEAMMREPLLLSQVVGVTELTHAIEFVWLMLEKRVFEEEHLKVLQSELQRIDLAATLLRATRGEMAAAVNSITHLEEYPRGRADFWMSSPLGPSVSPYVREAFAWIPAGFFAHSKTTEVHLSYDYLISPQLMTGLKDIMGEHRRLESILRSQSCLSRPDYLLARWTLSSIFHVRDMTVFADNLVRQARLACALELHFLEHLSFPPNLEELNATHLAGASLLAVDGNPMHYKLNGLGRYWLWSDGPDGVNDGGMMRTEKKVRGTSSSPDTRHFQGDWVWRYEPVKQ
ncbi:MAG: hypothetical protein ABL974_10575, partial [Prosthecobacter sp.]